MSTAPRPHHALALAVLATLPSSGGALGAAAAVARPIVRPLATSPAPAPALAPAPAPGAKTLWVSDDVNVTIYNVTLDGRVLSSFASGSVSGLAQGIGDDLDTLWAAKEGSDQVVHLDKSGHTLSTLPGSAYDPAAAAPEGVAVDFADGTLWIVDDVTDLVYHTQTDGTLIASFSTALFDAAATSPQAVATDPSDGSLWITDNGTHRVYNLTRLGAPVSSFPASTFGPATLNLQGIAVDDADGTLWLSARNSHTIYNLSRTGTPISTLDAALFGSLDPTGVAVGTPAAWKDLGHALDGVHGAPLLIGSGPLTAGSSVALTLTHGKPVAPAALIVGLSAIDAPFKGGVLVPGLDLIAMLGTDPAGAIAFSATWPDGLPGGLGLWMQWWISDAAGPLGFAASNALLATTPAP